VIRYWLSFRSLHYKTTRFNSSGNRTYLSGFKRYMTLPVFKWWALFDKKAK
jgi:hypothetical protein